ncbi:MAG: hypothetical protein LBV45_00195, partial [Xanthomonadaceae bacterium]|nr:hypothetical protein [Xanthomonadaceae bacterium]
GTPDDLEYLVHTFLFLSVVKAVCELRTQSTAATAGNPDMTGRGLRNVWARPGNSDSGTRWSKVPLPLVIGMGRGQGHRHGVFHSFENIGAANSGSRPSIPPGKDLGGIFRIRTGIFSYRKYIVKKS